MAWSWLIPKKKVRLFHGNIMEGESGRYIAYFDEFPEVVAQGSTIDETKERLVRGVAAVLERKREESLKYIQEYNNSGITHFKLDAAF